MSIAGVETNDSIVCDPSSIVVEEIRKDAGYTGVRVVISANLARAHCRIGYCSTIR